MTHFGTFYEIIQFVADKILGILAHFRHFLLGFHRIPCFFPGVPAAFQRKDLGVSHRDQLRCRPGTRFLVGSGSVENQGLFFWIFNHPLIILFGILPHRALNFFIALSPFVAYPDIQDDKVGAFEQRAELFFGQAGGLNVLAHGPNGLFQARNKNAGSHQGYR